MVIKQSGILNINKTKISIIIPVYNVDKYITACLNSVISQTVKDIQIICINDCSQDNSSKILECYAENDQRFVIVNHIKNKGLAAARNTGLAEAIGDYVYFLDSDDFLACDDALEILYSTAIKDESEETIGGILKWREETDEKYMDWHKNYLKEEKHAQPLKNLPQLFSNVIAVNKLLKRTFLIQNNLCFNESLLKNEDNPFSCKVHILAKRITIITKTTYIYRQQISGTLMSSINKNDAFYRCAYCHDIFKFIEEKSDRHIFRKMYYPMYSRQLISSAGLLEGFTPTKKERDEIIEQWEKIVELLPDSLTGIPSAQKRILKYVKNRQREHAWEQAVRFARPLINKNNELNSGRNVYGVSIIEDFVAQQELNDLLISQIQAIYNSTSWRITAPLRWIQCKIRGY